MLEENHPIELIKEVLSSLKVDEIYLRFSKYKYRSQTVLDERDSFILSYKELLELGLKGLLEDLDEGEDLALHSQITLSEENLEDYHLPMVDLGLKVSGGSTELIHKRVQEVIKPIFPEVAENYALFESGNSYHFYSTSLIPENEWAKFLGVLLLCNMPEDKEDLVDTRWVGHRILGGFGSLRWSCNNPKYKQLPRKA